jgi:hypothetical protein
VLPIGLVLDDVEPQHARLAQRCPRVRQRRGQELLDLPRPDPHMYMNDQHALILLHVPRARARLPPPLRARKAVGGSRNHGNVTL